jgi:hypothetical protein
MDDTTTPEDWKKASREYVARRAEAGTPEGKAYTARLESLPPAEAAAEIGEMFVLCAPEDLASEISCDLQMDPEKARLIACELGAYYEAQTSTDYEPMYQAVMEAPDTARAMLQLLDQFPEATVQDWWMVFHVIGGLGGGRFPPSWNAYGLTAADWLAPRTAPEE